ncbi:hypothetical protein GMDG_00691 [Pseudogymnoascus destructans 20631-21]|uniref:Rhodopsin domain-containing protein n=1 Tax=Pseudogymnoascus destructans (strain ATCC MYA-4855 / 20631-21) TaxID=658429 RepID=L8G9G4_PSED2|nr:hypothetical protein GMDG_00691 [Pseudogymnoascus destructans 20631-21]
MRVLGIFVSIAAALLNVAVAESETTRSLVSNRLWLDDWAVVVAAVRTPEIQSADTFINELGQVLMVPMVVIPIYIATLGFGRHLWDVDPKNVIILRKLFYISQILYLLVQGLAKVSILFYTSGFSPTDSFAVSYT